MYKKPTEICIIDQYSFVNLQSIISRQVIPSDIQPTKMKLSAILCLAMATALANGAPRKVDLGETIGDINEIINAHSDKYIHVVSAYLFELEDHEVATVFEYGYSHEIGELKERVKATPEYQAIMTYLGESDLSAARLPNNKILRDSTSEQKESTGGMKKMLDEIFEILDPKDYHDLIEQKLQKENFRKFVDLVKADQFKSLLKDAAKSPVIQAANQELLDHFIDLKDFIRRVDDKIIPGIYDVLAGPFEQWCVEERFCKPRNMGFIWGCFICRTPYYDPEVKFPFSK